MGDAGREMVSLAITPGNNRVEGAAWLLNFG